MIFTALAVVFGIVLIVLSADKFVDGASSLAARLGMSHFLIGLTIISIGTSAPELLVSAVASYEGSPGLALGNALGSNIANIALVLGATACVFPLVISRKLIKNELPILIAVTIGVCVLSLRGTFDFASGTFLLVLLPLILYKLTSDGAENLDTPDITEHPLGKTITLTVVGLAVLLISSKMLVWGATEIALYYGVSELIIGLTIVAIGTSLPELAASLASALRGKTDMALGTVIGSNFFNFLGVIGLAAVISPFIVEVNVINRDLPWVLGLTLLLWGMTYFSSCRHLNRKHGILLILLYLGYLWHIFATIVPIT